MFLISYDRIATDRHGRLYDKRKPHDPHYPAVKPSKGEETVHGTDEAAVLLEHAPPG